MILLPVTSTAQPVCGASVTPSHTRSGASSIVITGAADCRARTCAPPVTAINKLNPHAVIANFIRITPSRVNDVTGLLDPCARRRNCRQRLDILKIGRLAMQRKSRQGSVDDGVKDQRARQRRRQIETLDEYAENDESEDQRRNERAAHPTRCAEALLERDSAVDRYHADPQW